MKKFESPRFYSFTQLRLNPVGFWTPLSEMSDVLSMKPLDIWNKYHHLSDRGLLPLLAKLLNITPDELMKKYGHGDSFGCCPSWELLERVAIATGSPEIIIGYCVDFLKNKIGKKVFEDAESSGLYPKYPKGIIIDGKPIRTYPPRVNLIVEEDNVIYQITFVEVDGVFSEMFNLNVGRLLEGVVSILDQIETKPETVYIPKGFACKIIETHNAC